MQSQEKHNILFVGIGDTEQMIVESYLGVNSKNPQVFSIAQVEDFFQEHQAEVIICEAEKRGLDVREIANGMFNKPVVFLSSRDKDMERRKVLLKNQECYLTRPYTREALENAVTRAREDMSAH